MAQKKKNMSKCEQHYAWFHQTLQNLYLADFLKVNLANFAVIWVEKGQKAGFVDPGKLKNHTNQGKGKKKNWKSKEG